MYVWYDALALILPLSTMLAGERLTKCLDRMQQTHFIMASVKSIVFIRSTGPAMLLSAKAADSSRVFVHELSYGQRPEDFKKRPVMWLTPWLKRKSMVSIHSGTTCCGSTSPFEDSDYGEGRLDHSLQYRSRQ